MSNNFQTVTFHYSVGEATYYRSATATLPMVEEKSTERFAFIKLGSIEEEDGAIIFQDKVYRQIAGAWPDTPIYVSAFAERYNSSFDTESEFLECLDAFKSNGIIVNNQIFVHGYLRGYYSNTADELPGTD